MKISERQALALKVLRAVFPNEQDFRASDVRNRVIAPAISEPGNAELLAALEANLGRWVTGQRIANLLRKMTGRRRGDLELIETLPPDNRQRGRIRWCVRDHAHAIPCPPLPKPPRFRTLEGLLAHEERLEREEARDAEDARRYAQKRDRELQRSIAIVQGRRTFQWIDGDGRTRRDPVGEVSTAELLHRPPPDPPVEYMIETRVDPTTGRVVTTVALDRDGQPMRARHTHASAPVPHAPPAEPAPTDRRPPWVRRGELAARDKAEWLAYQQQRTGQAVGEVGPFAGQGVSGFADPGGVVSAAVAAEQSYGAGVHVCRGLVPWKF